MEGTGKLGLQVMTDQIKVQEVEVDAQLTDEVTWDKVKGKVSQNLRSWYNKLSMAKQLDVIKKVNRG